METHEIYSLNCTVKENRVRLVKETMLLLKLQEKPSIEKLEKISEAVCDKYDLRVNLIKYEASGRFMVSAEIFSKNGYSIFYCHSYYEMLCKMILLAKCKKDFRNMRVK